MKTVLITGAGGQLAQELVKTAPKDIVVHAVSRTELDIADEAAVSDTLQRLQPDVIINAAAYTAVDKAEEDKSEAYRANATGIEVLARCSGPEVYLLHVSTDFVFDGEKNTPYQPSDKTNPTSVYGETKRAGEVALLNEKPESSAVIRTAWVYSATGNNFVKSMLRFMKEREALNIVVDQVGTPTWTKGLAEACWGCCKIKLAGTYHWSDAGVASWYDFAEAIQLLGVENGLLDKPITLNPISTSGYPLPAKRPAYSVLDKTALLDAIPSLRSIHWQTQLREMFKELTSTKS